jgi:hypothetical protein
MTGLLLCIAALSRRSRLLSHQLENVTFANCSFLSHAERFQDCSRVLLYVYRLLHIMLPLSERQYHLIENLLDLYKRFLYPGTRHEGLLLLGELDVTVDFMLQAAVRGGPDPKGKAEELFPKCSVFLLRFGPLR